MSTPQFRKATKSQARGRIAITGPAGSGKTWTALTLATAICKRVAVIDTEHGSASKYADTFSFDTLELDDFHPDSYIAAIKAAEEAGYDGLIIDSASHEWSGKGGCLELVDIAAVKDKGGNKWAAWSDVTPLHNRFIEAIHQCDMHVFTTYRSKMDYIQTQGANGKAKIERVGMAPITREGGEYEHDIVLDMDQSHNGVITKTRCAALDGEVFKKPGADLAKQILAWLTDGTPQSEVPAPQFKQAQPAQAAEAVKPAQSAQPTQPAKPAPSTPPLTNGNGAKPKRAPTRLELLSRYDTLAVQARELGIAPVDVSDDDTEQQIVACGQALLKKVQAARAKAGVQNGKQ